MDVKRGGRPVAERVGEARENALRAMRDAGFDVGGAVKVAIDPKLPFMGYTRPQGEGFQVVVSGASVESGMLEGLLIHEMSHIYRMMTNDPSHSNRIITEVIEDLGKRIPSEDYPQRILHDLVNHIQDLYADDVAVAVMEAAGFASREQLSEFFQDWVKDTPVLSDDAARDAWMNASVLVNNARAVAQMERHRLKDIGGRASTANRRFLSRIPPAASRHFEPFRNILANLPTKTTESKHRTMLTEYLDRFLDLVKSFRAASRPLAIGEPEDTLLRREIEEWAAEPPMHGGD